MSRTSKLSIVYVAGVKSGLAVDERLAAAWEVDHQAAGERLGHVEVECPAVELARLVDVVRREAAVHACILEHVWLPRRNTDLCLF